MAAKHISLSWREKPASFFGNNGASVLLPNSTSFFSECFSHCFSDSRRAPACPVKTTQDTCAASLLRAFTKAVCTSNVAPAKSRRRWQFCRDCPFTTVRKNLSFEKRTSPRHRPVSRTRDDSIPALLQKRHFTGTLFGRISPPVSSSLSTSMETVHASRIPRNHAASESPVMHALDAGRIYRAEPSSQQ